VICCHLPPHVLLRCVGDALANIIYHIMKEQALYEGPSYEVCPIKLTIHKQWYSFDLLGPIKPLDEIVDRESRTRVPRFGAAGA